MKGREMARVRWFELGLDWDAEVEGVIQPGRRLTVHVVGKKGKDPLVTLAQGENAITLRLQDWADMLTWLGDHITFEEWE